MTFTAPSFDFFDDGLVHSHDWARNIPPGSHHAESRRGMGKSHDQDEQQPRDARRSHG